MKKSVEVAVKYSLGHTIKSTFVLSDLHCPHCGKRSVWIEEGAGDFYEGSTHLCRNCRSHFSLPRLDLKVNDEPYYQIFRQLDHALHKGRVKFKENRKCT